MIDKEDILERTSRGLAVFKHYINFPVRPGKISGIRSTKTGLLRAISIMTGVLKCSR